MASITESLAGAVHPENPPKRTYVAMLVVSVIFAFVTRSIYLHYQYFEDDATFLGQGPLHWVDIPTIFSPIGIHWFYRPIALIYFRLFNLFGHSSYPRHFTSILLFAVCAWLQSCLATRLSGSRLAGWLCLQVIIASQAFEEAVWWFASASSLLALLFSLCSIHAWVTWRQRGLRQFYPISIVCMMIAMCSKEDAATLPFVLAALDGFVLSSERLADRAKHWIPLAAWTAVWLALDLTAYHFHATDRSARIYDQNLLHTGAALTLFLKRNLIVYVIPLIGGLPLLGSNILGLLAVIVILAIRLRSDKQLLFYLAAFLLVTIPMPLLTGDHTSATRFNLFPVFWSALLWTSIAIRGLRSRDSITNICGWILVIGLLHGVLPLTLSPLLAVIVRSFLVVGALVLARVYHPFTTSGVAIASALSANVLLLMCGASNTVAEMAAILAGFACGFLHGKRIDSAFLAGMSAIWPICAVEAVSLAWLQHTLRSEEQVETPSKIS